MIWFNNSLAALSRLIRGQRAEPSRREEGRNVSPSDRSTAVRAVEVVSTTPVPDRQPLPPTKADARICLHCALFDKIYEPVDLKEFRDHVLRHGYRNQR